jgi:hypothetical protein
MTTWLRCLILTAGLLSCAMQTIPAQPERRSTICTTTCGPLSCTTICR